MSKRISNFSKKAGRLAEDLVDGASDVIADRPARKIYPREIRKCLKRRREDRDS